MTMLKNNLLSNPIGWSERAVGNRLLFVAKMVSQLMGAVAVWWTHGNPVIAALVAFVIPALYIYALRRYVMEKHTDELPSIKSLVSKPLNVLGIVLMMVMIVVVLKVVNSSDAFSAMFVESRHCEISSQK